MNVIFIDTNIYLSFYSSNNNKYKKLLNTLVEIRNNIFITSVIVSEIERNKLNIFRNSIENYRKNLVLPNLFLPEHLDFTKNSKLNKWNKDRAEIEKLIKNSNLDFISILESLIQNVASSKDSVSVSLKSIYSQAKSPNEIVIEKSKDRKLLGNPPGKFSDPIGDQINWEMLLSVCSKITHLWIVTNDSDYYTQFEGKSLLNPLLLRDLISRNAGIKISVCDTLSKALLEFGAVEKIKSMPSTNQLLELGILEKGFNVEVKVKDLFPHPPIQCKACGCYKFRESINRIDFDIIEHIFTCIMCGWECGRGEVFRK